MLRRLSWLPYSAMEKRHAPYAKKNWAILSPQPQCKQTTAQYLVSPMIPLSKSTSKPLTCAFIGSGTATRKLLHIFWSKGIMNRADCFTKHHQAAHYQVIHSSHFHEPSKCSSNYFDCLQGHSAIKIFSIQNLE